jgi:hypothetical protein
MRTKGFKYGDTLACQSVAGESTMAVRAWNRIYGASRRIPMFGHTSIEAYQKNSVHKKIKGDLWKR